MATAVAVQNDSAARQAMDIMFTEGVVQAEEFLFKLAPSGSEMSPKLSCAVGYVRFVKALMTWDEDLIETTIKQVKSVEDKATAVMKNKKNKPTLIQQLECQTIEGDCILIRGILTFTKMTLTAYVKAGFLLRSSSKIYDKCLNALKKMKQPSVAETSKVANDPFLALRASVSLGFGLVNLMMSLMPEKVLAIIKLLGFGADREAALQALQFCSLSGDMRSPVAKLVLLWYHGIARATLGLDGDDIAAGIPDSEKIMSEAGEVYKKSSLFLYFSGRIAYLRRDTEQALSCFTRSIELSGDQREVKHVNMYELGFISITRLEWKRAADAFYTLKTETKWSIGYYSYFFALCLAAGGDVTAANAELQNIPSIVKNKNSNYEKLVLRRAALRKDHALQQHEGVAYALELAYQWNQLTYLNEDQCQKLLKATEAMHGQMVQNPCLEAISLLIQGSLMMQMEKLTEAEKHFRAVLERAHACVARRESQLPAFATLEIGLIYMRQGEFDKAKNALSKAKNLYNDYEVENRLHAKARAMLSYMKQHGLSGTSDPLPSRSMANGTVMPSPAFNETPSAAKKSQDDIGAAIDEIETEGNSQPAVEVAVAAD